MQLTGYQLKLGLLIILPLWVSCMAGNTPKDDRVSGNNENLPKWEKGMSPRPPASNDPEAEEKLSALIATTKSEISHAKKKYQESRDRAIANAKDNKAGYGSEYLKLLLEFEYLRGQLKAIKEAESRIKDLGKGPY